MLFFGFQRNPDVRNKEMVLNELKCLECSLMLIKACCNMGFNVKIIVSGKPGSDSWQIGSRVHNICTGPLRPPPHHWKMGWSTVNIRKLPWLQRPTLCFD